MDPPNRRFLASWIVCILTFIAGCSETTVPRGPEAYPVKGKVMYRGKPAEGFRVAFHPLEPWNGAQFAPSGTTNAAGEFAIHSYKEDDGAPAGDYVVTFSWPQEISTGDPDDAPRIVDRLRGALASPQKSNLRVTIVKGENSLEPFVLQ
jgi:hypothetical protein